MIILGIDPGLATLGYGVIEKDNSGRVTPLAYGVVTTPKHLPLQKRLLLIQDGVDEVLQKYRPDEVAFEELFFTENITTGIAVAQARGVALLTCAKRCEHIFEYTPMQVKQALTGYGRADKKQMQQVVASILKLSKIPRPDDAADALAIALCQAFVSRFGGMFAVGNMTRGKGKNANPVDGLSGAKPTTTKSKKGGMGTAAAIALKVVQDKGDKK